MNVPDIAPWPTCEECGAELAEVTFGWLECPACNPGDYTDGTHLRGAPVIRAGVTTGRAVTEGRRLLDEAVTEAALQSSVLELAGRLGWLAYHPFDSRRSTPGWPDLALVRGDRLIFAELKRERGRATPEQRRWLDALAAVADVDAHLWRPSDGPAIEEALR